MDRILRLREATHRPIPPAPTIVWLLLTVAFAFLLFHSWFQARYFDGSPADGPFQLLNPLTRLDQGQLPARDFTLFHGLLTPFAHYPIYALLGHNLFASEFARQLLTPLAWVFAMSLLTHALVNNVRVTLYSLLLFAVLSVVGKINPHSSLFFDVFLSPVCPDLDTSLVPLRWAYPAASGVTLIWAFRANHTSPLRGCIPGIFLGLSPAWSYEQGAYAVAAAVLSATLWCAIRRPRGGWLLKLVVFVLSLGLTGWFSFHVLTGGRELQAMRFAFHTIPQNQGWYFGSPPNPSLAVLAPTVAQNPSATAETWRYSTSTLAVYVAMVLLLIANFLAVVYFRRRVVFVSRVLLGSGFLVSMAALSGISLTGYVVYTYLVPATSCTILLAISSAYFCTRRSLRASSIARKSMIAGACVALLLSCAIEWRWFTRVYREMANAPTNVEFSGVKLSKTYKSLVPLIARIRSQSNATVFSSYRGMLDIATNQIPHGRADYIIFAFADQEHEEFVTTFKQGHFSFVHTMLPSYFGYEEWVQMMHWDFYRLLMEHYFVVETSDFSILWERRVRPISLHSSCKHLTPDDQNQWRLPARNSASFFEVTAHYEIHNPLGSIPVIGGIPRYLVEHHGLANTLSFSINPNHSSATWLIRSIAHSPAWLTPKLYSPLTGATFTVKQILACEIAIPPDVIPAFGHLLSDSHQQ